MSGGGLRRRGDLAPILTPSSSQRALVDETEDPFEAYVISTPCFITVSNDPIDPDDFPELDDPCSITRYECSHGIPESSLTQVLVDFDYELHYRPSGNLTLTIESLESNVLQHLAASTGLVNCPITSTQRRRHGDSGRRVLASDLDAVVALESEPPDTPDPVFSNCIVPVQASEVRGAVCLPMKGSLIATIDNTTTASTTSAVRSDLLRIIRLGMKEDTYVFGNVNKVSFIGDRVGQQTDGATTGATTVKKGEGGLSNGAIAGISIGGVCLLLLLAAMLLLVRKRNRADGSERKVELDRSDVLEEDFRGEGGVEPWLPMAAPVAAATVAATAPSQGSGTKPNSMAARDTLALEPQSDVHKTTSELTIDDGTASLSSGSRSSGSPARAGSPTMPRRKKKKKRSPQRPGEQELVQTLDSIAEHPQEDEALQDSDRDDLPSIA